MAASPQFKIYDQQGTYQAACHEVEAAAVLVTFYQEGSTIRHGHSKKDIVWTEGLDGCASDSYDETGQAIYSRIAQQKPWLPAEKLRWEHNHEKDCPAIDGFGCRCGA